MSSRNHRPRTDPSCGPSTPIANSDKTAADRSTYSELNELAGRLYAAEPGACFHRQHVQPRTQSLERDARRHTACVHVGARTRLLVLEHDSSVTRLHGADEIECMRGCG